MSGPALTLSRGATAPPRRASRTGAPHRLLGIHVVTAFWAAALVFAVQPMVAKMVLPSLGGAPSVWLVSLVFFQGALLAGYAYAHLSSRLLTVRGQIRLHVGLLGVGLLALPVGLPSGWPSASLPAAVWLIAVLVVTVGGPFVAAVATGPLLHRWYAGTTAPRAHDPYLLFAAGNAGSLVALLAYPVLIEPRLPLSTQGWVWSAGYAALILLTLACARLLHAAGGAHDVRVAEPPAVSWRRRLRWAAYPFAAAALLVAVTHHLTVDVAAVPLLWVIPLAVYLITFIVAFSPRRRLPLRPWSVSLAVLAAVLAVTTHQQIALPTWTEFALHLLILLAGGLVAHTRLARQRPAGAAATGYLLWVALGGVIGGLAVAVLGPALLPHPIEYPLVVVAVLLARPAVIDGGRDAIVRAAVLAATGWFALVYVLPRAEAATGVLATVAVVLAVLGAAVIALVVAARPVVYAGLVAALLLPAAIPDEPALLRERTFFGDYTVTTSATGHHVLLHGTTDHGSQDPERPREPISYYHATTPLGQLMAHLHRDDRLSDVAVAGLGAGVLASHGRAGQRFVFYEIDPVVVGIATDPTLFTYLDDTAAEVEIEVIDARLGLAAEPTDSTDLVVLDAFTSNAIPVHLVTTEAISDYLRVLRPDGLLAVHISNRYVDLEPVLAAAAEHLGLAAISRRDDGAHPDASRSRWVLLAGDRAALPDLEGWEPPGPSDADPWTDDSSALWRVIRWR